MAHSPSTGLINRPPFQMPGPPRDPVKIGATAVAKSVDEWRAAAGAAGATYLAMFPWLKVIGFTVEQVQHLLSTAGDSPDVLLASIRQAPQYQARFGGIRDEFGQLRMNEADFLRREQDFKTVMQQHGRYSETTAHQDYQTFFNAEIDPNELDKRLTLWEELDKDRDTKDAFYVYAGMNLSTDDLYESVVNPDYAKALTDQYTYKVNNSPVDYATFIARASERARIEAERAFALTQKDLNPDTNTMFEKAWDVKIRDLDAQVSAIQLDQASLVATADVLYRGEGGKLLSLSELTRATELAVLGAAATGVGLTLPGKARVEQLRQAGITRAAAQQGYGEFAAKQNLLAGMGERAGFRLDQDLFERGALLREGQASAQITQATAQETSLGTEEGQAQFTEGEGRRVRQASLRRY